MAVGGFVRVGTGGVAEIVPIGVGPKTGVDDFDVVFGDKLWIIFVFLVEIFLEGVIHGVDGGLAVVIALKSIEVRFLD